MSLITRCPNCATMFKIVPDQLRISDGWVRCGRCSDIFDAARHLQSQEEVAGVADGANAPAPGPVNDPVAAATAMAASPLETPVLGSPPLSDDPGVVPTPLPVPASAAAPTKAPSVWLRRSGASALLHRSNAPEPVDEQGEDEYEDLFHSRSGHSTAWQETRQEPYAGLAHAPANPFDDTDPELLPAQQARALAASGRPVSAEGPLAVPILTEDVPSALLLQTADSDVAQSPLYDSVFAVHEVPMAGTAEAEAESDPEEDAKLLELDFVRLAERKAFWRRPAIVAVSALVCGLLALALAGQAALRERDRLAATVPALRPVLAALCVPLSCQVGPRRQIEAIAIEGSAFNKTHGNLYQLSIDLRSSATTPLAMPALELTLTDTDGQTLVRRVLEPVDLRAPQLLQPQGAWSGTLPMRVQDPAMASRIAGYGLLAFYP
ncbi:zinc-ribbon and DUF3426 domain-containing protein [Xylophilus ampelinus]|uniref:Putative Zn finger-like uncharacterized protein n=1 Tax=Xylophilus ampelinus TaxID=54067 RepID=A0A318SNN0_9BURK|nr:zinc-ribbon and DUF3426 domain-containing protein [Xylophilus ampelinus]MCS4509672.1 zinc-ribbon domain-containing protein [Xylophilus ampelinus]PYE78842.1 putative Zn finger-like uncharacterized protein [Xylophilus ampelinus]